MLDVKNIDMFYGGIHALKGISLKVNRGEIVSLIGANGAGKTTTLKVILGLLKIHSGEVIYEGKPIHTLSTQKIVASGLSLVPEGRHIFKGMTVLENLEMGAYLRKDKQEIQKDIERMFKRFPILKKRQSQDAATLSGGEQQMLAMSRALMSRPQLLLLDEPSMGLAPLVIKEIFELIKEVQKQGTTILLIEQNAKMALSIATRGYVIENGVIVLEGTGEELLNSEEVKKAYLGQ